MSVIIYSNIYLFNHFCVYTYIYIYTHVYVYVYLYVYVDVCSTPRTAAVYFLKTVYTTV